MDSVALQERLRCNLEAAVRQPDSTAPHRVNALGGHEDQDPLLASLSTAVVQKERKPVLRFGKPSRQAQCLQRIVIRGRRIWVVFNFKAMAKRCGRKDKLDYLLKRRQDPQTTTRRPPISFATDCRKQPQGWNPRFLQASRGLLLFNPVLARGHACSLKHNPFTLARNLLALLPPPGIPSELLQGSVPREHRHVVARYTSNGQGARISAKQ